MKVHHVIVTWLIALHVLNDVEGFALSHLHKYGSSTRKERRSGNVHSDLRRTTALGVATEPDSDFFAGNATDSSSRSPYLRRNNIAQKEHNHIPNDVARQSISTKVESLIEHGSSILQATIQDLHLEDHAMLMKDRLKSILENGDEGIVASGQDRKSPIDTMIMALQQISRQQQEALTAVIPVIELKVKKNLYFPSRVTLASLQDVLEGELTRKNETPLPTSPNLSKNEMKHLAEEFAMVAKTIADGMDHIKSSFEDATRSRSNNWFGSTIWTMQPRQQETSSSRKQDGNFLENVFQDIKTLFHKKHLSKEASPMNIGPEMEDEPGTEQQLETSRVVSSKFEIVQESVRRMMLASRLKSEKRLSVPNMEKESRVRQECTTRLMLENRLQSERNAAVAVAPTKATSKLREKNTSGTKQDTVRRMAQLEERILRVKLNLDILRRTEQTMKHNTKTNQELGPPEEVPEGRVVSRKVPNLDLHRGFEEFMKETKSPGKEAALQEAMRLLSLDKSSKMVFTPEIKASRVADLAKAEQIYEEHGFAFKPRFAFQEDDRSPKSTKSAFPMMASKSTRDQDNEGKTVLTIVNQQTEETNEEFESISIVDKQLQKKKRGTLT